MRGAGCHATVASLLVAATGTAHAGNTASPACTAVLASNATATILPTARMIAPYVPYSRSRVSSAVVSAVQKLQSQSTSNPTSIVQKAAVAALNGPQQCVAEMRAEYIRLRDHIVAGLCAIPGIRCTMPEGAFYAYPNVSALFGKGGLRSAADVAHGLLHKAHVATVAGEGFGTTEHVRISYATSMENLNKALQRIRKYVQTL